MSAETSRVALVFGSDRIEVDPTLVQRRGGLRVFAREAESKWGLAPSSFSFVGSLGKVDSVTALQRELLAAPNGVCKVEVHENPEAKVMRKVHAAVKASEDRILAKIEASLANIRNDLDRTDKKVSGVLAPMVQCLALEHLELHDKVGRVAADACDHQLGGIMKEINQLASLAAPAEGNVPAWSSPMPNEILGVRSAKTLENVDSELQQDCILQAARDLQMSARDDVDRLKMEVCSLDQSPTLPAQNAKAEKVSQQTECADGRQDSVNAWLPYPPAPVAGFAYSSKATAPPITLPFDTKWRQKEMWGVFRPGTDDAAAFPQHVGVPRLSSSGWTWGSRSMPTLPPL